MEQADRIKMEKKAAAAEKRRATIARKKAENAATTGLTTGNIQPASPASTPRSNTSSHDISHAENILKLHNLQSTTKSRSRKN